MPDTGLPDAGPPVLDELEPDDDDADLLDGKDAQDDARDENCDREPEREGVSISTDSADASSGSSGRDRAGLAMQGGRGEGRQERHVRFEATG